MQFTSKFILLVLALAYGGSAVSAVPVRESSIAARSAEYEELSAREIDDMELVVREPFSFFGFGSSSSPKNKTLSTKETPAKETSHEGSDLHKTEPVSLKSKSKSKGKGRGAHYNPQPTMDVASRRKFRKSAAQDSALLNAAAKDKNHPYHSTAIHMKQEEALRKNQNLLNTALNDPKHALHGAAQTVKAQNSRRKATYRAALKDENHSLHDEAVAHRNEQHDKTIKNAQLKNPKLVQDALANKNHKLHEAAHRVAAQDNAAGFAALPYA